MAEAGRVAPRLIVFTDTARAEPSLLLQRFAALAERAEPGRVLFVLRDYALPLRARFALGERLSKLSERTQQAFGVAERADLARALGCAGFHLPQTGLCASDARHYLGSQVFLSRGSHDPNAATEGELDAALLSPIFEARKGRSPLGLSAIEQAQRAGQRPALYALGGVDPRNAAACLAAGAAGVAVIGAALLPDSAPLLTALGILRRSPDD